MPRSQIGKCNCCKCKDCKCKVSLYKCGGSWSPVPKVKCKNNSIFGKFIFEDSIDCGGVTCEEYSDINTSESLFAGKGQRDLSSIAGKDVEYVGSAGLCCTQQGCTHSKICLDKKYVFKFRVSGLVESSRAGKHKGDIYYRKICCTGKKNGWKKLVSVESKGGGPPCCLDLVEDSCKIILPEGKYEFRFRADAVDSLDHLDNFLQYDAKWCPYVKGEDCCPNLPPPPVLPSLLCSGSFDPIWCCPPPVCVPNIRCNQTNPNCNECSSDCGNDPCTSKGWLEWPDSDCGSSGTTSFNIIYNVDDDNIINIA